MAEKGWTENGSAVDNRAQACAETTIVRRRPVMSAASTHGVAKADRRACPAPEATTLCEAFQRTAALHADFTALRTPDDSVVLTWADYAARVQRTAAGLAALGVGGGDSVGARPGCRRFTRPTVDA
jgi:hypothetical protein